MFRLRTTKHSAEFISLRVLRNEKGPYAWILQACWCLGSRNDAGHVLLLPQKNKKFYHALPRQHVRFDLSPKEGLRIFFLLRSTAVLDKDKIVAVHCINDPKMNVSTYVGPFDGSYLSRKGC